MQFTYKATTKEGKTVSGTAEAASRQALLGLLTKQGLSPVLIQTSKGKHKSKASKKEKHAKPAKAAHKSKKKGKSSDDE